jgi:hypothetical protein
MGRSRAGVESCHGRFGKDGAQNVCGRTSPGRVAYNDPAVLVHDYGHRAKDKSLQERLVRDQGGVTSSDQVVPSAGSVPTGEDAVDNNAGADEGGNDLIDVIPLPLTEVDANAGAVRKRRTHAGARDGGFNDALWAPQVVCDGEDPLRVAAKKRRDGFRPIGRANHRGQPFIQCARLVWPVAPPGRPLAG